MAKATEFEYVQTKAIGTIGNKTVELGHYVADGKAYDDKVYIFEHFEKKDGTKCSKAIAKLTVEEFNALKGMEV